MTWLTPPDVEELMMLENKLANSNDTPDHITESMADILRNLICRYFTVKDLKCLDYIESLVKINSSKGLHSELAYTCMYQFKVIEELSKMGNTDDVIPTLDSQIERLCDAIKYLSIHHP